ncbi:MAG TPA: hypothetical protein VHJ20_01580 [Polyangia bacterium]|nr:hypothetical protein [Polyangia bacterium]
MNRARLVLLVALTGVAGALGGLTSCETIDLGPPPADVNACRPSEQFFVDEIWPNVLAADYGGKHCYDSKCHDPGSGRRPTFIGNPQPPLTPGQAIPQPLPDDWAQNYRNAAEEMNCADVGASPLIDFAEGQMSHPGGALFKNTDPQETKLRMWVTVTP